MNKVYIQANEKISERAFLLSFKRDFTFRPGQVIEITSTLNIPPRMYSIASGTRDNCINIFYTVVDSGDLTPILSKMQTGDPIYISEPKGSFLPNEASAWFIANGTGIAPFLSLHASGLSRGMKLIHGARNEEEFYFQTELSSALHDNYIKCCSSGISPRVFHGRVTKYIAELAELPSDIKYYLCGSAEMVVEVRDLLISKGINFQNILSEIYF